MSGYKDRLKERWQTEKERTSGVGIRGQMKSLVGRGEEARPTESHAAPPLSSLPPGPGQGGGGGYLNQSALTRLGEAGISVPGLGITPTAKGSAAPPPPPPPRSPSGNTTTITPSHMSELQSRFSQFKTPSFSSSSSSGEGGTSGGGTTFAQKQAALRTAAALRENPRSVSLSDMRAAAGTAENFRQRHGGEVAGGLRAASELQGRFGGVGGSGGDIGAAVMVAAKKKKPPPPPPPKKKAGLSLVGSGSLGQGQGQRGGGGDDDEPPPIPMATRPQF
ncbi:hypothetical protein C8A00DRAFT_31079 [Chaetomidium leptoderma]|uniref:Uncharacterized protein n=1 Tax=Chaetomidium leptoderma TaxID=669021 RepID=A0AAN6VR35_9PEZI|nr:hypothetical protein C8A00DRAFT_31079 [Chaetomidium leptoderma]